MAITSSGGVVSSGTTSNYDSGDSITDFTIYGTVTLNSATATSGLITSGGIEYAGQAGVAVAGGISISDNVESGGVIHAENYGLASSTIIGNGGTVQIDNGGSGSNIVVSSGGVVSVFTNYSTAGIITSTTVLSGGAEILSSGATGVNDSVASGGSGYVYEGATEIVSAGSGSGITAKGGRIIVSSDGVATREIAESGGYIGVAGGTTISAIVLSGATMDLASSGGPSIASNTILSGGTEYLYPQGSSVSGIILSGGKEYVGQGGGNPRSGTSIDDTVSAGGQLLVENGGTASGAFVSDGGLATIANGGQNIAATVGSGGVLSTFNSYNSAGISISTQVLSGGSGIIGNGGSGYNESADQGGTLLVSAGGNEYASSGTATNVTALSGGNISVFSSGVMSGAVISSGGSFRNGAYGQQTASGQVIGTDIGTIVSAGGSALWYNGARSISAQILSGASVDVGYGQDGALTSTNMLVFSSATIYAGGYAQIEKATIASSVILDGGSMSLVGSGGQAFDTVISSGGVETLATDTVETGAQIFQGGEAVINASSSLVSATLYDRGSIDFNYLGGTITSATVTSSGKLTAYSDNGSATSVQLAGAYPEGENTFLLNGDTVTLVCFLGGTAIRTPSGAAPVESLQIGDEVMTYDWRVGREVAQKLVWVGSQRNVFRPHLPDDEAGYPVRICAGAIADGVPARDLMVTPEHCLFFDGMFVPARMLVNGRSIFYDRSLTDYAVYHIETAQHAVLWAEEMLSESYLDTGNRRHFTQHGKIATTIGTARSWEEDAAAPLVVVRDLVEPLFLGITKRAGMSIDMQKTMQDHDLHLRTAQGVKIAAARKNDDRIIFHIPPGVDSVSLVSRASRPFDAIGPFVDDRRMLGVLVQEITLFDGPFSRRIDTHLALETLSGWHRREAGPHRWTDGNALLPLGSRHPLEEGVLAIQIAAAGPYVAIEDRTSPLILQA